MNSFLAELMRRIKLILDWFSSWEITTVYKEGKNEGEESLLQDDDDDAGATCGSNISGLESFWL